MSIDNVTQYASPAEREQAAAEARKIRQGLGAALRAADETAREHNPLHNRFRPRSRAGREVTATLRAAMPEHASSAATTADRLREQRRCLNRIADTLTRAGELDVYVCNTGTNGIDLEGAPALARILDAWRQAHAATDTPVPATTVMNARTAALLAQIDALAARAARMRSEHRC